MLNKHIIFIMLLAVLACFAQQPDPKQQQQCHFSSYLHHPHVTSWEFQVDVPPDKCINHIRDDLLHALTHMLVNFTYNKDLDLKVHFDSLRTSVFDQYSAALTTLDGKPLFPSTCTPTTFPFRGPAFIRHRRKHAMYYYNNATSNNNINNDRALMVQPGRGDLTLKIKDVNLDAFEPFHKKLKFCKKVKHHGSMSKMKWKIENDRYCNIGRATYEALYHPVRFHTRELINTRDQVETFFPGLWRYFGYRHRNVLPLYNQRYFTKSVWDAQIAGVDGVINWVVSYPTLLDALTGSATAIGCEMSMRLKREWVGREDEELLEFALNEAVNIFDRVHQEGWDTGVH